MWKKITTGRLLSYTVFTFLLLMLIACGSSRELAVPVQENVTVDLPQYIPVVKRGDQLEITFQHPIISYHYTAEIEYDGSILLPGFGRLKVVGMSIRDLEYLLASRQQETTLPEAWTRTVNTSIDANTVAVNEVDSTARETTVLKPKVRIINYSISVLGLVERPGQYPVHNQHITVFEALALAGYKTMNTKHGIIKVLREDNDGELRFYTLHLEDRNIVHSPAYYLEQNDVLYVHPSRTGKWASGLSSPAALGVTSLVSLLISLATLVVHVAK